jgi:hypothetical protein
MLQFLEQHRLLLQRFRHQAGEGAGVGDVGHGKDQPDVFLIAVVEFAGAQDQTARLAKVAVEVHFEGVGVAGPDQRSVEQYMQSRRVPLTAVQLEDRSTD